MPGAGCSCVAAACRSVQRSPASASASSGAPRPAGIRSSRARRWPIRPGRPRPGGQPGRPGAPQGMRPAAAPGQTRPRAGPSRAPGGGASSKISAAPRRSRDGPGSGTHWKPASRRNRRLQVCRRQSQESRFTSENRPLHAAVRLIEKRYAEGERKLHPVRTRAGAGAGRAAHAEPVAPVQREPRKSPLRKASPFASWPRSSTFAPRNC